eukprot:TRINITY_DN1319_c0_g1_i1.p1 TRINITY_DN1319_c0_g1~~TRINITY_DN1319_c0_g1_i1.p1  ORF type:complete len:133 (-),score=24.17 TRINITY_DN1319_c0_g1_i1:213-611(-)
MENKTPGDLDIRIPVRKKYDGVDHQPFKKISHKNNEQKRRKKINEKIEELKRLIGSPDGQNTVGVLEASIQNVRSLRSVCAKLEESHKDLQVQYQLLLEDRKKILSMDPINHEEMHGVLGLMELNHHKDNPT